MPEEDEEEEVLEEVPLAAEPEEPEAAAAEGIGWYSERARCALGSAAVPSILCPSVFHGEG